MNKVTVLHTKKGYLLPDDLFDDIRLRIYGWNIKDLAEEMEVSTGCVYAIRRGKTKWPRGTTLFALLKALDLAITVIDLKTGKALR